jgi:hypothetical protein
MFLMIEDSTRHFIQNFLIKKVCVQLCTEEIHSVDKMQAFTLVNDSAFSIIHVCINEIYIKSYPN